VTAEIHEEHEGHEEKMAVETLGELWLARRVLTDRSKIGSFIAREMIDRSILRCREESLAQALEAKQEAEGWMEDARRQVRAASVEASCLRGYLVRVRDFLNDIRKGRIIPEWLDSAVPPMVERIDRRLRWSQAAHQEVSTADAVGDWHEEAEEKGQDQEPAPLEVIWAIFRPLQGDFWTGTVWDRLEHHTQFFASMAEAQGFRDARFADETRRPLVVGLVRKEVL
jgi:hypothetical protein